LKRFILSLALLAPLCVQAQMPHHEIGLMAGVANYYGDLQDKVFDSRTNRPMGGITYKYFMNPHLGVRMGVSYTNITAADSLSGSVVKQNRNLRFSSNLFEAHAALEINFLPIEVDRMKITPYIFGGIAVFHYNPYTDGLKGERVYLRPLSTEGQGIPVYPDRKEYKLTNISFPIGGGIKFFVGKTLMITTEVGFRYTNTDYLDDVSRSFVDRDTLIAYRGRQSFDLSFRGDERNTWDGNYPNKNFQRGDSKANDWYMYAGLSVGIYLKAFGNVKDYWQANCPAFFRR
jgi:hypothetical protein